MDDVARAFYESKFEVAFLRLKGTSFQDKFADIMEKRHPDDFVRIRSGGREGDHKADGYLRSQGIIYQVYAPLDMTVRNTVTKINEDFKGAQGHWGYRMRGWTFVHNSRDGLLPGIVDALDVLEGKHKGLSFGLWGYEELRIVVFELPEGDLDALFGSAPSMRALSSVSAEDLKMVIEGLAGSAEMTEPELGVVPPDKLSKNLLSDHAQLLLRYGMASAHKVQRFFDRSADPGLGDKVAGAFKYQYGTLKGQGLTPDEIFHGLRDFTAVQERTSPQEEVAVLALLAYLFEQCDIFERPEAGVAS